MDFLGLAKARKTVYDFTDEPVTEEQLNNILEAGRWAPSTYNCQPWSFIITRDAKKIQALSECCHYGEFHKNPPVMIAIILEPLHVQHPPLRAGDIGKLITKHAYLNTAMPALNMVHTASSQGLGSAILSPQKAEEVLSVPDSREVVLLVALGHEKLRERKRDRKALAELTHAENYGER